MAVQNDKAQSPATLMDVAKEAHVSIATASRVLNGSTRKVRNQSYVKVMEAATKLNYRPNAYAQAVAKGTAPNIVLLVSDISDPYFASVSQGVVKAAAERGISVTIGVATTPHEELEAVRKSVSTRPRGIIISESEYTDAPERQALQTELTQYEASGGRAVFVLNRSLPFPAVDVANDVGARAIAKLIVDSGYTRPAILKGDDAHRSSKERLAGVMEVLDEAGITVDPKAVANGKFSRTDGYAAVMQMVRSGLLKPGEGALYNGKGIDSIIALNDVMAIGAMTALRTNGIEPGREIGVTGFGDIPYSADAVPSPAGKTKIAPSDGVTTTSERVMATATHHTTDSYTDEIEELFDYRVIEQPATTSGHHSMIIGYGNQAFADHGGELVNRNGSESLGRAAHTRIVDGAVDAVEVKALVQAQPEHDELFEVSLGSDRLAIGPRHTVLVDGRAPQTRVRDVPAAQTV